jgi:hypothetical protein
MNSNEGIWEQFTNIEKKYKDIQKSIDYRVNRIDNISDQISQRYDMLTTLHLQSQLCEIINDLEIEFNRVKHIILREEEDGQTWQ